MDLPNFSKRIALSLFPVAWFLVGCETAPSSESRDAALDSAQTMDGAVRDAARSEDTAMDRPFVPAPNLVPSEAVVPAQHHVTLASLPAPRPEESTSNAATIVAPPIDAKVFVPAGFEVNLFASGLTSPRWLAATPDGRVLVTEHTSNTIRVLTDENGDGASDLNAVFASASAGNTVNLPLGMAFAGNSFFLANTNAVMRFDYQAGQASVSGPGTAITNLPGQGYNQHWTRNVVVSADGTKLYVSVGSQSNVGVEPSPRASVLEMNLDGSERRVLADGLRNPTGLAVHPVTGELYTSVNERDQLGNDLVPDFFTRVQDGAFYGWPYTYLAPQNLDPRFAQNGVSQRPDLAARTVTPDVLVQAHSAALGIAFYRGETFPPHYRSGAFLALRGSWNRNLPTGYKIVFVPFGADNRPLGTYEDFLTGFVLDEGSPTARAWARPVGTLILSDGSLLVSDEANGRIYRIQYRGL